MKWIQSIKDFFARIVLLFYPIEKAVDVSFIRLGESEEKEPSLTVLDSNGETLIEDDGTTSRAITPEEFDRLIERREEEK